MEDSVLVTQKNAKSKNEKTDPVLRELAKKEELSIITLLDNLIYSAHEKRASDIHFDPSQKEMRVRIRVDGVLQEFYHLPKEISGEIIARVKVVSGLRTDEHQTSQDGRFRHMLLNKSYIDIRVSIAPTYYGENVVFRLLSDNGAQQFTLESLGFEPSDQKKILDAIHRPNGMILVTGPTGSGKTTTLYTLIRMLNVPGVSVVTIEDPIEYAIDGVEQMQVNSRFGLTFANGLRTILRQDPNIIMVGEIRDSETAGIAVNTALTGHLLLSTLHTNDAATTLPRLLDMKVEAFLVASTINIAIGQRLVRSICTHCKSEVIVTSDLVESLKPLNLRRPVEVGETFFAGAGCEACSFQGYSGRISISEVLVADSTIRQAILRHVSAGELREIAIQAGMTTMLEDGFAKVRAGKTTVQEILRVVHE